MAKDRQADRPHSHVLFYVIALQKHCYQNKNFVFKLWYTAKIRMKILIILKDSKKKGT